MAKEYIEKKAVKDEIERCLADLPETIKLDDVRALMYAKERGLWDAFLHFINSLPTQGEWSKEDEEHRKWILECLADGARKVPEYADQYQSAFDWFHNLRKPAEVKSDDKSDTHLLDMLLEAINYTYKQLDGKYGNLSYVVSDKVKYIERVRAEKIEQKMREEYEARERGEAKPEADLDAEIHRYFNPYGMNLQFDRSKGDTIFTPEQLIKFARHFAEWERERIAARMRAALKKMNPGDVVACVTGWIKNLKNETIR